MKKLSKYDKEIYELLKIWSNHLVKPLTHSQLVDFANKACKYSSVFFYGQSYPVERTYRGYSEMSLSDATKLCGGKPKSGIIHEYIINEKDMSWTPFRQLAFDVAIPEKEGYWYAVGLSNTVWGQWLLPGLWFKDTIKRFTKAGYVGLDNPEVMASEYLLVVPPHKTIVGKLAIVEYVKGREFEDVARELDLLSQKLELL